MLIESFLLLAVRIAASFNRFAKSAPVKPGVLLAILSRVKSS
jgi:type III secretory pathway component EscT